MLGNHLDLIRFSWKASDDKTTTSLPLVPENVLSTLSKHAVQTLRVEIVHANMLLSTTQKYVGATLMSIQTYNKQL